jgi:hypothetical protein
VTYKQNIFLCIYEHNGDSISKYVTELSQSCVYQSSWEQDQYTDNTDMVNQVFRSSGKGYRTELYLKYSIDIEKSRFEVYRLVPNKNAS